MKKHKKQLIHAVLKGTAGLGFLILLALALGPSSAQAQQGQGIINTLVYHQITSFTSDPIINSTPLLSDDGNRIVFAQAPGPEPARTSHIFVINADGSGQHEVDTYEQRCSCGADLDISADGSTVISTDSVQLRIANADGSGRQSLIELDGNEIGYIRISGDGSKVFFQLRRDVNIRGTSTRLQRGVYALNPDGSELQQVVGPDQLAALLDRRADNFFTFTTNGPALDVSTDGSSIVFGTNIIGVGQGIFGVNIDGTELHQFPLGPTDFVNHAAISGDGGKVSYDITPPPCCSSPNQVGVINFDGTGRLTLATNRGGDTGDLHQLSADGSKLLLGSTSFLIDTETGATLQLGVRGGWYTTDPPPLLYDGMFRATMNSSATRFLYMIDLNVPGASKQLAIMDLNPESLGEAPSITDPTIDPTFVLTEGRSAATITGMVSTKNTIVRVSSAALRNGLKDNNVNDPVLVDDGTMGDVTPDDGIFTSNRILASSGAVVGPRTLRLKAEVRASDGKRHATAVEFEPFSVLSEPPEFKQP
jgi:Tol biopolymer transport system component